MIQFILHLYKFLFHFTEKVYGIIHMNIFPLLKFLNNYVVIVFKKRINYYKIENLTNLIVISSE